MSHRSLMSVSLILIAINLATATAYAEGTASCREVTEVYAHPSQTELLKAFQQAAADYNVPVELLKAVAYQESRWVHTGPTIDYGYGIMHLVDNDVANTLQQAADRSGYTVDQLKNDAIANINAGAALLSHYAKQTIGQPTKLEDYQQALRLFTGLHQDVQDKQVAEYYRVLHDGAKATNRLGMDIDLKPTEVATAFLANLRTGEKSTDYGPAIWNPADSSNYSTYRGVAIDRWVNHWIGVGSYAGAISWFKNPSADVSAHFVIRQSDGELTQMVRIAYKAWHCGNWNSRSIGIEHEATPDYPWPTSPTAPMLVNSATCCSYFCDLYGIPKTRTYIVGHQEVPGAATACPGPLPWDTYMALVAGEPDIRFTNAIANGGFEDDFDSWSSGSSTTTSILTSGTHGGSKACQFYRSGGYATIWQNPGEVSSQSWRTTCYAYRNSGMTSTGFGFKDQSGNDEASATIDSSTWQFYSVDWNIADDIDVQAWGTGAAGVVIDDVRAGKASRMNWITDWIWNGTYAANLETDFFAADGGEANIYPEPGETDGGNVWTQISRPDGFIDLDDAIGADQSNCVTYAHVFVLAESAHTDVNLVVGADDAIKVFLNGVNVHTNDTDSSHDYFNPDEDVIEGLTLNAGENRLLIKVREATGGYSFSARFCDDNGDAIDGLTYTVTGDNPPAQTIIVESRSGGQNTAWYSEEGVWADSSYTSTATGITAGIGSRYGSTYQSVAGLKRAYFAPNFPVAGTWRVYATWPGAPLRRSPITYRIAAADGFSYVNLDQTVNENTWVDLGEYQFASGQGGSVRVSNDGIDASGSMYASAIKFVLVEIDPLADYAAFATCLAGPGVTTPPAECTSELFDRMDFDADGDIDLRDFAALQGQWE